MTFPRTSIICPSMNQGRFLTETIESVLSQNYPNLEFIIVDGGSTDGSVDIIKKYTDKLAYWVSEKDHGQTEAINKGLKRSTGEIIGWLCSDDVYLPGALHKVSEIFQSRKADFIHGKTILFDEKKEIIKGAEDSDLDLRYFAYIPFPQPSSFFKRKLIDEIGLLDESLHYGMDYDLLIRVALLEKNIFATSEIFSKYRLHDSSKSVTQLEKFLIDWQKIFSKFLRSVPGSQEHVQRLRSFNLYHYGNDIYMVSKKFAPTDLKKIVLYFLEVQMHVFYKINKKEKVNSILGLIKEMSPGFYADNKLGRIHLRNMLPSSILNLVRKAIN